MKKIICVVGARPNFMKMAPLYAELKSSGIFNPVIVHTGQHYDYEMSKVFFEDLDLPEPNYSLTSGSGSHAEQTAKIMVEFEKVLLQEKPDLVVVFGDVNSTLACSITAKKMLVPVAHVEAGLRSFDMTMPEEVNRRVTDSISDMLFTPSRDGDECLLKEGVQPERIHLVGNIMIDSLVKITERIREGEESELLNKLGLIANSYALITLHRPSNVDDPDTLKRVFSLLSKLSTDIPLLFPIHPRTRKKMRLFGIEEPEANAALKLLEPMGYRQFAILMRNSRFVLTDSGGIQEETTFMGIPCLTLRPNTERPVTITEGTNELVTLATIPGKVREILGGNWKKGQVPFFWDGKTASRIVEVFRTGKVPVSIP